MTSTQITRRRLLNIGSRSAALASAASLLPPNVQRFLEFGSRPPNSLRDIKHVVMVMQENRSFDHYFGTLAGVRGLNDPKAMSLASGRSVFFQPDALNPQGYVLPFHLDTRVSSAQRIPSTDHSWLVQHESLGGGRMDAWLTAHRKADGVNGPYVMGYYTRADIPFHFALAEAFTVCDAYHCSVLGPTWPNRLYWITGTIDPDGRQGGPAISNRAPKSGFTWTTYPERLEKAGISWQVYQQKDNYDCNVLEYFRVFQQAPKASRLYERGMARGSEGQFEYDAIHDKLPTVSWIIPTSYQSEHPDYLPADGAAFVASKIEAIAANPDVWAKTVFVLNYDENDGMFDHVPPPLPPSGTSHEFVGRVPIGSGFRVPCIIVSPWTAGGWVCSQTFDHTSVLQLLEKVTGVREPNISEWRRRTFGDMTSVFRFRDPTRKAPTLPNASGRLSLTKYESLHLPRPVLPGENQSLPTQEEGRRKSLPAKSE